MLGNLFGILTVFQLLELANPSQPLLRRLLIETPGTYHHSLMVGNLAERAAESIGADALLARVAAYYHDIGKLANPLAFIENQAGGDNIHDELDPEVSAQILKQHVVDGIDLAYKYHLPKTLIAFIPQHHGTALMSYFYAKARDLAAAPWGGLATDSGRRAADEVDQRRFRHAGPKPQTREAAILMLADGVEASVRSLDARDEAAIRAMVGRIIGERLDRRAVRGVRPHPPRRRADPRGVRGPAARACTTSASPTRTTRSSSSSPVVPQPVATEGRRRPDAQARPSAGLRRRPRDLEDPRDRAAAAWPLAIAPSIQPAPSGDTSDVAKARRPTGARARRTSPSAAQPAGGANHAPRENGSPTQSWPPQATSSASGAKQRIASSAATGSFGSKRVVPLKPITS